MLMIDQNKTQYPSPSLYLSKNTAAPFAQLRSMRLFPHMLGQFPPQLSGIIDLATTSAGVSGSTPAAFQQLVTLFESQAHDDANQFVTQIQNPFAAQLSQIVDAKDAAVNGNVATAYLVQQAKNAVITLWSVFSQAAQRFAAKGPAYATVATQGLNTLNGPNGMGGFPLGFINTILSKMDSQIATLGGTPSGTLVSPILTINPLTGAIISTTPTSVLSGYTPFLILGAALLLMNRS